MHFNEASMKQIEPDEQPKVDNKYYYYDHLTKWIKKNGMKVIRKDTDRQKEKAIIDRYIPGNIDNKNGGAYQRNGKKIIE